MRSTVPRRRLLLAALLLAAAVGHGWWLPTSGQDSAPAPEGTPVAAAAGVPLTRYGTLPARMPEPDDVQVAVSPWVAARLGLDTLSSAEAVFADIGQTALHVTLQPTVTWWASPLQMTTSGLEMSLCDGWDGFASIDQAEPVGTHAAIMQAHIRICDGAYDLDEQTQVALVVHEVGHILGFGHVHACSHVMVDEFTAGCQTDMGTIVGPVRALYPPDSP